MDQLKFAASIVLEAAMVRAKATARRIGVGVVPEVGAVGKVPDRLASAFQQPTIFAASSRFSSPDSPAKPGLEGAGDDRPRRW